MKKLALILVLVIATFSAISQTTKKQPYVFDNWVELNDSLKIGDSSNLKTYGEYLRIDTLSDGSYYFKTDTVATPVTVTEYDSLLNTPFKSDVAGKIQMNDTSSILIVGGFGQQTNESILYVNQGIQRKVIQMAAEETTINCNDGDIFIVEDNTAPTSLTTINCPEGRTVTIIGKSSGIGANTTKIALAGNILLDGAKATPYTFTTGNVMTFITVKLSGVVTLIETSRSN